MRRLLVSIGAALIGNCGGAWGFDDLTAAYRWDPLKIGGSAWVTGMVSHPTTPDLRIARTDTGGFYRWEADQGTWRQLATADRFPDVSGWVSGTGVESVALAASAPDTLYVAMRDAIYRSDNRGDSFTRLNATIPMEPNSQLIRSDGERLAVDPRNPDIALFGSRDRGLWRTENGADWSALSTAVIPSGEPGAGIPVVKFDPNSPALGGRTSTAYVAVRGGGVYATYDAMGTWSKLSGVPGGPLDSATPTDAEVHPNGDLYLTYNNSGINDAGVWRYRPGAGWGVAESDWQQLNTIPWKNHNAIAIDPTNPNRMFTATDGLQETFFSENGGASWRQLSFEPSSPTIPWAQQTLIDWVSSGEYYFDPHVPGRLWMAEGVGVWYSDLTPAELDDDRMTFNYQSEGIEEMVPLDIVAPPGGAVISFGWDRTGFRHENPDTYTATQVFPDRFSAGWDGAYRPGTPTYLVTTSADDLPFSGYRNNAGYSTDGGVTWQPFASLAAGTHPDDLKFGAIAAAKADAAHPNSLVWLPADSTRPYFSTDGGATWSRAAGWPVEPPGSDSAGQPISSGLWFRYFRFQGLVADPHQAGAYWLTVKNRGLWRSEDGGDSWQIVSDTLPNWGHHATLLADPSSADRLWYANGDQESPSDYHGLFVSNDSGLTFTEIPGTEHALDVALGAAAPGSDSLTVYLLGIVQGQQGLFRSLDDGANWDFLVHYPMGIFDAPLLIEASPDRFGEVYVGFSGTGFAIGRLATTAGDYNLDGTVTQTDYQTWREQYGQLGTPSADGNRDGRVDVADYTVWRDAFGAPSGANAPAVPEPASAWLAAIAWLAAARRPRRNQADGGGVYDSTCVNVNR
ncbi:hypothetical protein [Botrimarina hoheduenensis]|uniref:Xyloglucanase n=1 Tax=Botrimarina hoheduenensis TaxID=2528000 RepID=A0A5C5WB60_9BACT|nr:hypothetical protein [Botrimarina hoheduenensis]TWT46852.1 Xyloglucanase precursor [Botrimarina hoheduenensis]